MNARNEPPPTAGAEASVVDAIVSSLRAVRFGSIEIVVHDGRVVQIIRTEKIRFER